jgi:hypothetical protein
MTSSGRPANDVATALNGDSWPLFLLATTSVTSSLWAGARAAVSVSLGARLKYPNKFW